MWSLRPKIIGLISLNCWCNWIRDGLNPFLLLFFWGSEAERFGACKSGSGWPGCRCLSSLQHLRNKRTAFFFLGTVLCRKWWIFFLPIIQLCLWSSLRDEHLLFIIKAPFEPDVVDSVDLLNWKCRFLSVWWSVGKCPAFLLVCRHILVMPPSLVVFLFRCHISSVWQYQQGPERERERERVAEVGVMSNGSWVGC